MLTSVPDEFSSERPSLGEIDDVFAYVRRLVGSAEPAIVFSSLVALCVPGFSDFCFADIIEGGRVRYRIAAPRSAERRAGGSPSDSNATTRELFEIRTTFDCALDGWSPYTGVMVHRWRDYQPDVEDEDRAARIVGHAIRVIRDERLADPMRPEVAPPGATFQRARGRR
jgi:hypothetical protein